MEVEFKLIGDISTGKVQFYTVTRSGEELSEFEKFVDKDFPEHKEEIEVLYQIIEEIGRRGAKAYYFKFEKSAHALPKVGREIINANTDDFGIRLYCIRISDELVILLNGNIKTTQLPQDCDNVKGHFSFANKIADQIDKLLAEGEINFSSADWLNEFMIEI